MCVYYVFFQGLLKQILVLWLRFLLLFSELSQCKTAIKVCLKVGHTSDFSLGCKKLTNADLNHPT